MDEKYRDVIEQFERIRASHKARDDNTGLHNHVRDPAKVMQAARSIEQIRQWRVKPDSAVHIGGEVKPMRLKLSRNSRRLANCIAIWDATIPPELSKHVVVGGIRQGVLTAYASSSPVLYELDRLLREGAICEFHKCGVHKINLKCGPPPLDDKRIRELPPHEEVWLHPDDEPGPPLMSLPDEEPRVCWDEDE